MYLSYCAHLAHNARVVIAVSAAAAAAAAAVVDNEFTGDVTPCFLKKKKIKKNSGNR